MKHFIIPDTQCKKDVPVNHLTAAGNYIVDKKPDVIVHLGDHWDMHSLSSYDKGTLKGEGARLKADIFAGREGMDALLRPIRKYNESRRQKKKAPYKPRLVFLLGNHEERILRYINTHPELDGFLGYENLELEKDGWEVHEYKKLVEIDGIWYTHFFYNNRSGKPYGGKAHSLLNTLGFSYTQGHQQGKDLAEKRLANGNVLRGLIVGSFYQHDEDYLGPQGNNYWRGCVMKHEVENGNYCIMELSLDYLMREWL